MEDKKLDKKNKIIIIIVAILAVISASIGGFQIANKYFNKDEKTEKKTDNKKEQITPLMYEITKEGSNNKIYLFGSMHIVNLDEFDFPDYVMNAYNNSDILAPEFDLVAVEEDIKLMTEYSQSLMYDDGTTIKDHLSEETYNMLIKFLKDKNLYSSFYERFKPEFFDSLISSQMAADVGLTGDGVDTYFLKKAKKDGKEIIEVESFEFQSTFLNSIDEKIYDLIIYDTLSNYENGVEELKELYKIWKSGNKDEIERIALSGFTEEDLKRLTDYEVSLIEQYNYKMLDERNIGMKNKLVEFFNNDQKVFFMVGAAHLVGENGIANLLVQEGYTVKQVNQ